MPATGQDVPAADVIRYYPNDTGEQATLVPDPGKFTVGFSAERVALSPQAQAILREHAAPIRRLPRYGLTVYSVPSADQRDHAVTVLNRERAIELAAPVLHRGGQNHDDILLTRRLVVAFRPEVSRAQIDELGQRFGTEIVETLGYVENGFLLLAPPGDDGLGAVDLANAYRETGLTRFAHPDLISTREHRAAPAAAATREAGYLDRQWHLEMSKVRDAWSITTGRDGITVAILDDGVDVTHPEFAGKLGPQHDFTTDTADGTPKTEGDEHGTACAGVAAARGERAAGAARGCTLMPVRFPAELGDADEARMFAWAADHGADVISCSWGPADGLAVSQPIPGSTKAAISYCVTQGRGGKGTTVLFAAGNGDESVDLDGYASNPDVIAVGAVTDRGRRAWYSDHGNAICVCAPSSGDADAQEKSIITTDRLAAEGYNSGDESVDADYTDSFGGTSSAAPLVAGIVALMLSANDQLTSGQVKAILRDTANRQIGTGYDQATPPHSPSFGYGVVNAYEAVRAAQRAANGASAGPGQPSVTGPASVEDDAPAPRFDVDPGGGAAMYYAIEVATESGLLDAQHAAERTDDTYYASWWDSPLLAVNPYVLPDAAWQRLSTADRLYYRAWLSTSPTAWQDVVVTTDDADLAQAPSMQIDHTAIRTRRDETVTHAGLDRLTYPGDDVMQALYNGTNLAWTGFYLAPAPSQSYTGWMGKAATLRAMGWGLAPIYVGQQWPGGKGSHTVTADQGAIDAADAVQLADTAGIGDGAVIYLDVEVGGRLQAAFVDYCRAWFAGVRGSRYRPGVYCSYSQTADQLRADDPDVVCWVFRVGLFSVSQGMDGAGHVRTPPISQSGCPTAIAWQFLQDVPSISYPDGNGAAATLTGVDLDCATVLDPSYPEFTGPIASSPTITGPRSLDRNGPPPQFDVHPGSGPATSYAVEMATSASLLDAENGGDRTDDTYYASWQDTPLQAVNPYEMPGDAWQRLAASADSVYYRAWFSSSTTAWADIAVTTDDADLTSVPSIAITGDRGERDALASPPDPQVTGPDSVPRGGPAPVFRYVLPPGCRSYRLEFATDVSAFIAANATETRWFMSGVTPDIRQSTYTLPDPAWQALRAADRLYYRICASGELPGDGWTADYQSTPDAVVERAPWVSIVDDR